MSEISYLHSRINIKCNKCTKKSIECMMCTIYKSKVHTMSVYHMKPPPDFKLQSRRVLRIIGTGVRPP